MSGIVIYTLICLVISIIIYNIEKRYKNMTIYTGYLFIDENNFIFCIPTLDIMVYDISYEKCLEQGMEIFSTHTEEINTLPIEDKDTHRMYFEKHIPSYYKQMNKRVIIKCTSNIFKKNAMFRSFGYRVIDLDN